MLPLVLPDHRSKKLAAGLDLSVCQGHATMPSILPSYCDQIFALPHLLCRATVQFICLHPSGTSPRAVPKVLYAKEPQIAAAATPHRQIMSNFPNLCKAETEAHSVMKNSNKSFNVLLWEYFILAKNSVFSTKTALVQFSFFP